MLDLALDDPVSTPADLPLAEPSALQAVVATHRLAQAFRCGPYSLAISYDWARSVVEEFDLVEVPKAPHWLAGACNVEGNIVPVVDLAAYFDLPIDTAQLQKTQRLLVGGIEANNSEDAIGFIFSELPMQLRYLSEPLPDGLRERLPEKLSQVCHTLARDVSGQAHLELAVVELIDLFSDELNA